MTEQLKTEISALATALSEKKELGLTLRIALEQYRDITTWQTKLPNDVDTQKTLAEIWRVREELKQEKTVVSAIAEGLRILRLFFPLPI